VPDSRSHRGPDPRDRDSFGTDQLAPLRSAVSELCWLLDRGYSEVSALKLVGDRHRLTERQRQAVRRCTCLTAALERRIAHEVPEPYLANERLLIDGFNVLTSVETALGGGMVLIGRDGSARDIAGVHGTFRRLEETRPSIRAIGQYLEALGVSECEWLLDRPVSNSGRLCGILIEVAAESSWSWNVRLEMNPDPVLIASEQIVATADSAILDRARRWFSLARRVIQKRVPEAWVVDFSSER
jgi:hypothetical protein